MMMNTEKKLKENKQLITVTERENHMEMMGLGEKGRKSIWSTSLCISVPHQQNKSYATVHFSFIID